MVTVGDTVYIPRYAAPDLYWIDRALVGTVIQQVVVQGDGAWTTPQDYVIVMMPSGRRYRVRTSDVRIVKQEWVEVPNQEGAYHGKHRKA